MARVEQVHSLRRRVRELQLDKEQLILEVRYLQEQQKTIKNELLLALIHTVEYVGTKTLPPLEDKGNPVEEDRPTWAVKTWNLDPDHKVARRFVCGHVQTACCKDHLDMRCDLCTPLGDHIPSDGTS